MNRYLMLLMLMPLATNAEESPRGGDDELLQESRRIVQQFSEQLQSELFRAMAGDGPSTAVQVCRERAPEIADALARETGARVGRTSLKVRNPQNLPEPWQRRALLAFEEAGAGAPPERLERFESAPEAGVAARYMKAIVTKPMCLACHGEPAESVKTALDENYPHDRATGYGAGEIRGAFHVTWPQDVTVTQDD